MQTTFVKMTMLHSPVDGWMAICQRDHRLIGIVGIET